MTVRKRRHDYFHRPKGASNNARFTADAFLLIHLYAVVDFCDRAIWAALSTGRVFTVMARHRTATRSLLQDCDPGNKLAQTEHVLFIIVSHHAGNFAGMTSNTAQVIGHNKSIHKTPVLVALPLVFIRILYLTGLTVSGNVHLPKKGHYLRLTCGRSIYFSTGEIAFQ